MFSAGAGRIGSVSLLETPRKRRQTLETIPGLRIGDTVQLPDGREGILRYIGDIEGKVGEFAGVELINEWASHGLHNGEYEG